MKVTRDTKAVQITRDIKGTKNARDLKRDTGLPTQDEISGTNVQKFYFVFTYTKRTRKLYFIE